MLTSSGRNPTASICGSLTSSFVIDKLTQRPEIADVRTAVVYEHLRNDRISPGRPAAER